MSEEKRYTLTEAAKIFAQGKCATEGHSVLWSCPMRVETDGPNTPGPLFGCIRCNIRCFVTYPLDRGISWDPLVPAFLDHRRVALRKQCNEPKPGSHSPDGHDLVHLDREEWVCSRCDALITFQEVW